MTDLCKRLAPLSVQSVQILCHPLTIPIDDSTNIPAQLLFGIIVFCTLTPLAEVAITISFCLRWYISIHSKTSSHSNVKASIRGHIGIYLA